MKRRRVAPTVVVGVVLCASAVLAAARGATPQQRTTWDGVFTEAQVAEGGALYKLHCASCHGDGLGGGEVVPALTGVAFSATWEGMPLFDLFERMRTSMPPGRTSALPRAGYASILAFMLKSNGMPAGDRTLGPDKASLAALVYRTYKP